MNWFGSGRKRMAYVAPMKEERLLECFAGAAENRLLEGVLYVLRRLEERARADAAAVDAPDGKTVRHAMRMSAFQEAEEEVLEMVDLAERRISGADDGKGSPRRKRGWRSGATAGAAAKIE